MKITRRRRILSAGKSPSLMAMKRTYNRAIQQGGVTQDFSANVENIREISRKLGYNVLSDATFFYTPSSYGESKNFAQVQNKRNLLQWSEEFDNAIYAKSNATITANSIIAPNGTTTADKIVETAVNNVHIAFQQITVSANTTYTASVYAKAVERTKIAINNSDGLAGLLYGFDLINGTSFFVAGTIGSSYATITNVGNGWFKCSVTRTMGASVGTGAFQINILDASNNFTYQGVGGNGAYIWGAQIEIGAYATPYQKTVAAGDGIVDLNFTRATSSTVTNKQGVIEDSCYNLIQRSEEFDNAIWGKLNSTITPNFTIAPNGTLTADRLLETSANNVHQLYLDTQSPTLLSGTTYSYSIYVKPNGRDFIRLSFISTGFGSNNAVFNITNGTISGQSNLLSANIIDASNGWYRLTIISTAITTVNDDVVLLTTQTDATTFSFVGDITKGCFVWGAQLTQGSTPRLYLRTSNRLNVPRLDYSRGIGEPELLIEPQTTNLNRWSGDLTNVVWDNKINTTTTANTNLNPFGTLGSTYLTDNSTNGSHLVYQTLNTVSGQTYTTSFYVKKADDTWCQFFFDANRFTTVYANFNFDTGLFGNTGNGTWRAKQLINGYWLITVTATSISTATGCIGGPRATNNTDSSFGFQYAGTGRKYCDVAAIQTELGSTATTYIPTTTATVTRNAETSYVDLFNNAALNKTNFTLYWEGYLYDGSGTGMSFCLSDSTTAASNTNQIGWYSKLAPMYNISNVRTNWPDSVSNNSFNKLIIQYNNGIVNYWLNGSNILLNKSVPVFDYRYLVVNSGGSTFTVDKITLFNRTLTNSECGILTT